MFRNEHEERIDATGEGAAVARLRTPLPSGAHLHPQKSEQLPGETGDRRSSCPAAVLTAHWAHRPQTVLA